jgi:hypothetical protein
MMAGISAIAIVNGNDWTYPVEGKTPAGGGSPRGHGTRKWELPMQETSYAAELAADAAELGAMMADWQ